MICAGFTDWLGVAASSQKMSSSCFTDSTQRDFQSRSNPRKICYSPRMDIDLTGFSAVQQPALFDLLILSMYADGHLTTFEDEQLQKLLATMGFVDEIDRQREFDAAVTRVRPFVQSIHQAKEEFLTLATAFTTRSQQKRVYEAVEQMVMADQHVTSWESVLLMELRMKFRL